MTKQLIAASVGGALVVPAVAAAIVAVLFPCVVMSIVRLLV